MNKMISVIIPMYNAEHYVAECLESLAKQKYTDFEAIVVNDGSTDKSGEIVQEFARKDKRFKLINQENKGVSSARNTALAVACGDYLYFMDADDFIDSKTFEYCMRVFQNEGVDLLTFDAQCVFEEEYVKKVTLKKTLRKSSFYDRSDVFNTSSLMDLVSFLEGCMEKNKFRANICYLMVNREIIRKNRIFFDEKISYYEDYMFFYRLAKYIEEIYYIPKGFYYRRLTGKSLMTEEERNNRIVETLFYCLTFLQRDLMHLDDRQRQINKLFATAFLQAVSVFLENSYYRGQTNIEIGDCNLLFKLLCLEFEKYIQVKSEIKSEYENCLSYLETLLNWENVEMT